MTTSQTPSPEPAPAGESVPVLIIGGGVTGLSAALFLSWHGVRPLLVERHPDLLIHPRARGFNQRTVELYRQVGLEPAIWSRRSGRRASAAATTSAGLPSGPRPWPPSTSRRRMTRARKCND